MFKHYVLLLFSLTVYLLKRLHKCHQIQTYQNQVKLQQQKQKIYTANQFLAFTQPTRNYTDMIHNIKKYYKVLVLSSRTSKSQDNRKAIKKTWQSNYTSQVFFVVGNLCPIPFKFRKMEPYNLVYSCQLDSSSIGKIYDQKTYQTFQEDHLQNEYRIDRQLSNERNNVLRVNVTDTYRSLTDKLKYGYKAILEKYPKTEFVIKGDDDVMIKLNRIEKYLKLMLKYQNPMLIGQIHNHNKIYKNIRTGKNSEHDYPYKHYPPFPFGGGGHFENRAYVDYVVDNLDRLKNFQGEDTSSGIWLDASLVSFRNRARYVSSNLFTHQGKNCADTIWYPYFMIGHHISSKSMIKCWKTYPHQKIENLPVSEDVLNSLPKFIYPGEARPLFPIKNG